MKKLRPFAVIFAVYAVCYAIRIITLASQYILQKIKGSIYMRKNLKPFAVIFTVYIVCYAIRMVELMLLRTDQSFWGEAFIQKLAGVVILVLAMRYVGFGWADIGLSRRGSLRGTLIGLALGLSVFALAYVTECIAISATGELPSLSFYVSAYALDGSIRGETTFFTVMLCVVFNILNVVMEEGIFRGLFTKLAEKRFPFLAANAIASLLFGLWHIALPIRSYADGAMSAGGAFASGAVYVVTSFLMGFQLGLLAKMTGGLWTPMAVHFVNNCIVNLLHTSAPSGDDMLQSLRISVAQAISFAIVLIAYVKWRGGKTVSPKPG